MTITKPVLASLAALSLVAAPVAAQAREPSTVSESEELAGSNALLLLALAAFVAALVLVVADEDSFDDVDDLPASP